jgi:hypothetical protein
VTRPLIGRVIRYEVRRLLSPCESELLVAVVAAEHD